MDMNHSPFETRCFNQGVTLRSSVIPSVEATLKQAFPTLQAEVWADINLLRTLAVVEFPKNAVVIDEEALQKSTQMKIGTKGVCLTYQVKGNETPSQLVGRICRDLAAVRPLQVKEAVLTPVPPPSMAKEPQGDRQLEGATSASLHARLNEIHAWIDWAKTADAEEMEDILERVHALSAPGEAPSFLSPEAERVRDYLRAGYKDSATIGSDLFMPTQAKIYEGFLLDQAEEGAISPAKFQAALDELYRQHRIEYREVHPRYAKTTEAEWQLVVTDAKHNSRDLDSSCYRTTAIRLRAEDEVVRLSSYRVEDGGWELVESRLVEVRHAAFAEADMRRQESRLSAYLSAWERPEVRVCCEWSQDVPSNKVAAPSIED